MAYPKDEEIRVEVQPIHRIITISSFFIILFLILYTKSFTLKEILSSIGLYFDILGVIIASLKTPYYGLFADGGTINFKRERIDKQYFQRGMYIIACGFLLQAISNLI